MFFWRYGFARGAGALIFQSGRLMEWRIVSMKHWVAIPVNQFIPNNRKDMSNLTTANDIEPFGLELGVFVGNQDLLELKKLGEELRQIENQMRKV